MPPRRRHQPGAALRTAAPGPGGSGGLRDTGEVARVLVDGRNVQHALARGTGSSLPTAALVARLRAAFSPPTEVELILDGHAGGSPQGRVSPGLTVVFTKGWTADQVIGERVSEAFRLLGPVEAWAVMVVTDDREVRDHARRNGVRVQSTAWLGDRLRGGAAAGVGRARAPRGPKG